MKIPFLKKFRSFVLFLTMISGLAAAADSWQIPDAPYRAGIKLRTPSSAAETGVEIRFTDYGLARADLSDLLLLDPDGQPVPIAKIGHRPGDNTLLLAKNLAPKTQYFLYFGGDKTRISPEWVPKVSLLMETKPAPANLRFESLQDLKTSWDQVREAPGAGFVNQIYQGGNPFGPDVLFLTRYSGYLNLNEARDITFYTLSSDCSFVVINDQLQFGWPGQHSPRITPDMVPKKTIPCPAGLLKIDYYAAKGDVPPGDRIEAATVLGWQIQDRFQAIPPEEWLHPGTTQVSPIKMTDGNSLPIPRVTVESFIGYSNRWLYEVSFQIHSEPAPHTTGSTQTWNATWEFEDGSILTGSSGRRLLAGSESQLVKCRFTRNDVGIDQIVRTLIPDKLERSSINDPTNVRHLVELITAEASLALKPEAIRERLEFLCEFGTDRDVAQFAEKLPDHAQGDPLWMASQLATIRFRAQTDPEKARQDLINLTQTSHPNLRQSFSNELASTEMEILVYCLRDPAGIGRLNQISFLNNNQLGRIAKIRAGDLYRLLGRYKEAVAQYQGIGEKTDPKTLPVRDSAESIAIRDLLDRNYPRNAKARLDDWELRHPMAKFESDFLLLRARTFILLGRPSEALAELESYQKLQPESPFRIDAQFFMATLLLDKGEKEEGRKRLNQIAKDYPKHPLAQSAKALAAKP